MKKISCKLFFTVVWRGICQVLGWFFGLFGYKREGKFAKCVWGVFSVSAAVVMAFIACALMYAAYDHFARQYRYSHYLEESGGQYVSHTIGYVADYDGNDGYLINKQTKKKVLKGIDWIAMPLGKDSLVCFSNGSKRGYFNMKDGKVVIEPKYEHAWIFNNGLAGVVENGTVKFVDGTGKVVIDNVTVYDEYAEDYVFHGGHLVFLSNETGKYGMIDHTGNTVLPFEFDDITMATRKKCWSVSKDGLATVYDNELNIILPPIEGNVYFDNDYIDVTMADHTMRKYDYEGKLVNDFYISCVNHLQYDTEEVYLAQKTYSDNDDEELGYPIEKSRQATARLRSYEAGNGYEGLMTPDGHIITMPLYQSIEAIGRDTYLCTVSNGDKVIVNGKGEVVK